MITRETLMLIGLTMIAGLFLLAAVFGFVLASGLYPVYIDIWEQCIHRNGVDCR